MAGEWQLMGHARLWEIYDWQSSPPGDDKGYLAGMLVGMARHDFGMDDTLSFRAMLSPDLFLGKSGYPLLLVTGETANGTTPLVDRQHPMISSWSYPARKGPNVGSIGKEWLIVQRAQSPHRRTRGHQTSWEAATGATPALAPTGADFHPRSARSLQWCSGAYLAPGALGIRTAPVRAAGNSNHSVRLGTHRTGAGFADTGSCAICWLSLAADPSGRRNRACACQVAQSLHQSQP